MINPTMPPAKPGETVLVACMRDEALFVVEWVAHHLAVGFDRIIVYTNDCADGTDRLLDMMAPLVPVERYDNPGPYDAGSIQRQALALAYGLPHVRQAEWVLHIDADEYINVTTGGRRMGDLLAQFTDADAIAIQWRHFGSAGLNEWHGGSVVETFTQCEATLPLPGGAGQIGFKTVFRPRKFGMMGVHMPKFPTDGAEAKVVNAAGVAMPVTKLLTRLGSGYDVDATQCTWQNACLHHHHVKSDDLHRLKYARGDANGRANRKRQIGSDFYLLVNKNDVGCTSLVEFREAVRPMEAQIRALPGVMELEAEAMAWFRKHFRAAG